jgi:hypothetical protein
LTSGDRDDGGILLPELPPSLCLGHCIPPKGSLPNADPRLAAGPVPPGGRSPAPGARNRSDLPGFWAEDAAACTPYEAFRITPEGFSAREEICRTTEAHKEGKGWVVHLQCALEGSESNVTVHWELGQDGRLREKTQNGRTATYVRCK